MTNTLLKYSKQELARLLQTSLAVAKMDKNQKDFLNAAIARASEEELIDLFGILRNERQFLDRTEAEFSEKFVKMMDNFVMNAKANVYKIKHKRDNKAEKNTDKNEKIVEQELLKKLNQF